MNEGSALNWVCWEVISACSVSLWVIVSFSSHSYLHLLAWAITAQQCWGIDRRGGVSWCDAIAYEFKKIKKSEWTKQGFSDILIMSSGRGEMTVRLALQKKLCMKQIFCGINYNHYEALTLCDMCRQREWPLGIPKDKNSSSHGDHFARIRIQKGQELRSGERKNVFRQLFSENLIFHVFGNLNQIGVINAEVLKFPLKKQCGKNKSPEGTTHVESQSASDSTQLVLVSRSVYICLTDGWLGPSYFYIYNGNQVLNCS